ncbi:MAG: hypothetical protein MOB07_14420 [Acidobacteria bacterium]|nr:hypothetical protein [Acidobacteriota bacterium]
MELIFTQTEPGREPESRAKTKTFYLRWNEQQVGNIRGLSAPPAVPAVPAVEDKTAAGVAAP